MKTKDPRRSVSRPALRERLSGLRRLLTKLPIPLFLAVGFSATLAWVILLCWAAYSLITLVSV